MTSALDAGRRTMRLEAESVAAAAARLDARFERAVELLASGGRVIVSGIGKSGVIAQKIAATLTSTGTAATYLHPIESLHGDLGLVDADSVAIVLSKSGETEELVGLLAELARRAVPLIAIVGAVDSTLGRAATVALDGAVAEEACPHDLAPTTSTTVALALGDALAVALLERKGFRREDFAALHPGGRLGRRLLVRVRDVMVAPEWQLAPAAPMRDVVVALAKGRGLALIVDGGALVLVFLLRRVVGLAAPVRPVEVQTVVGAQGGVLPVPGIHLHDRRKPGHQPAFGRHLGHQHAVGAQGRRDVGVGVVGDQGSILRVQRADVAGVLSSTYGPYLDQAHGRVGGDQAGVHVFAGGIVNAGVFGAVEPDRGRIGDEGDLALIESDGAVGNDRAIAQMCRGAENEDGARLLRSRHGRLGVQGSRENDKKQGTQHGCHDFGCYFTAQRIMGWPSIKPSSTSPICTGPTPAGVPVKMMSPFCRVK